MVLVFNKFTSFENENRCGGVARAEVLQVHTFSYTKVGSPDHPVRTPIPRWHSVFLTGHVQWPSNKDMRRHRKHKIGSGCLQYATVQATKY